MKTGCLEDKQRAALSLASVTRPAFFRVAYEQDAIPFCQEAPHRS
jgi:hypothetical protein